MPRSRPTIVAMAGLPATGKSTIARELAAQLGAPLFDKDRVREALFGPSHVAYAREQDDFCMRLVHEAVEHVAAEGHASVILLDGRTYSRRYQVKELDALAARLGATLVVIECVASRETVRARLELDLANGAHPARDRTFERWLELEAAAEPLARPALRVDTSRLSLSESVELARAAVERAR